MNRDLPGAFTHFSPRGASVIDYILASPSLLSSVINFYVTPYHESDHLLIQLFLDLPLAKSVLINPSPQLHSHPKWSHSLEDALHHWVKQEPMVCLNSMLVETTSPTVALLSYASLIDSLSLFLNSFPFPHTVKNPHPWFDSECFLAKSYVRQSFLSVQHNTTPASLGRHVVRPCWRQKNTPIPSLNVTALMQQFPQITIKVSGP